MDLSFLYLPRWQRKERKVNTETTKEKMQLVETRPISIGYANRKVKDGYKRYRNTVRMYFDQEQMGTQLFFLQTENGFVFSKEPMEDSVMRDVKAISNNGQKFISMLGIAEEGSYDIYKMAEGKYQAFLKEEDLHREFDPDNRAISDKFCISIPKEKIEDISTGIKNPCYLIEEFHEPRCYIKITCVEEETIEDVKILTNYGANKNKLDTPKLTYKRYTVQKFTVNRFFCSYLGLKPGDKLSTIITGTHEITISKAKMCCEFCGKKITYKDKVSKISMCPECDTASKIIRRKMKKGISTANTLYMLKNELIQVNKELKEMLEEK